MGRASVAVFALVTGYVNSLSAMKKSRAGDADAALAGVAKSAFRRTGRFMIPAVVATTISWLMCQFGAYKVAKAADSMWIRDTSPSPSPSFALAFYDLFKNLGTTWIDGFNAYDRIQWTLTYLLKGSMMTYLTLFATVYVKPKWRMFIIACLFYFKWKSGDALVGFNIFCGMFLAELSIDPDIASFFADHPVLQSIGSSTLIIAALFFASYPEENPSWARWSNGLTQLGHYMFPSGVEYARYYPGLGADMLALGVLYNTTAKKILSSSTVLAWALFGASTRPPQGKDSHGNELPPGWLPIANRWVVLFVIPLFYVFLYRVAGLWAQYVDPKCTQVTQWFEEMVFRDDAKAEKPILS
ncbi:MAG: hypothetical protein Q9190_005076 [Brigantiaea leucoxantha]